VSLSAQDHAEITNLYAAYCFCFDAGDGPGFAALFASDGRFVRDGQPDACGAGDLNQLVADRTAAFPNMRHFTSNILVEAAGTGASGRASVLVLRVDGPRLQVRTIGEYHDAFVRESGAWRFAVRRYAPWLPAGLMDGAFVFA
jgi:hypothetical protein